MDLRLGAGWTPEGGVFASLAASAEGMAPGDQSPGPPWDLTLYACSSKVSGRQEACDGSVSRFRFPGGLWGGKRVSERLPGRPKSGSLLIILGTPGNLTGKQPPGQKTVPR